MSNNNQPYSNMVRKIKDKKTNQKKLSGLHFTPYKNYYPMLMHLKMNIHGKT